MSVQVIISAVGPLPVSQAFTAPSDEQIYLEVNGSVWTQTTNNMIGIAVELDGQPIGVAQIYSNGNATHRAVVPVYIPIQINDQNSHTLTLIAQPGTTTVSDDNDRYTAVLHF
jgi:hypothetical protein